MLPHAIGKAGERVYSAPDVASALDFTDRSRREGRYQFFRGQENSDWLPYPSLARVPDEARDQVKERILRFMGYVRAVASVAGIHYSDDDIWAIAQHYGLPTNFLDLTTDAVVAAMFACPASAADRPESAAILLYAQDSIDLWSLATKRQDDPCIELLRIDVSNLWRLQAQRGLFLFIPFSNFCDHWMPDRVVFPHPADGFVQPGYELYPQSKSPLELQLDLFFDLEASEQAKSDLRANFPADFIQPGFSAALVGDTTPRLAAARAHLSGRWLEAEVALHEDLRSNASGISNVPLRTLPDTFYPPQWKFRHGELSPHESWFDERALDWLKTPIEAFQPDFASTADDIDLDLGAFEGVPPCGPDAAIKADALLGKSRERDVRFSMRRDAPPDSDEANDRAQTEFVRRVGLCADYLWAGLRRTPASTELIARCVDSLCAGAATILRSRQDWDQCYGQRHLEHLKVEYVPLGGHSRTARVLCADLAPAMRLDIADVVDVISASDLRPLPEISLSLRQMIYPQYLFDFERFAEVVIARVLPYEALIAAWTRQTPAGLAFNPRTMKIFGLG
jgi:FRG domain